MKRSPLLGTTEGAFDSLQVRNPPFSGALVDVTTLVGSGGGGSSYDDTALQALVSANSSAIALKANQATTYTKTEVDTAVAAKADQSALQGKQDLITTGNQIGIGLVNSLQSTLDAKAVASVTYTKGEVNTFLAAKADQSALQLKQDLLTNTNQIPISHVNSLQSTLNAKAVASVTYTMGQTDALLAAKAPQSTTYTKTEVDTTMATKAPQSTTYTKTEVDTAVATKAPQSTTYTKTEVDTAVATKAPQSTTYTKTEVDTAMATKAPQSTTYTKTEVDTTMATKADQSTTFTQAQINILLSSRALANDVYSRSHIDTELATKDFYQLSGVTWIQQQAISFTNATLDHLNLALPTGRTMQWRCRPGYGDMAADAALICQAQLGHCSLVPDSTCEAYFPFINSASEQIAGTLHWVEPTPGASQGTWGVYRMLPPRSFAHGGMQLVHSSTMSLFPNRTVPTTQVTQSGVGWPSGLSDAWTFEWQLYVTSNNSINGIQFKLYDNADADTSAEDSANVHPVADAAGRTVTWTVTAAGSYDTDTVLAVTPANQWNHLVLQKSSGSNDIRSFSNGAPLSTVVGSMSVVDHVKVQVFGSAASDPLFIREVAFWNQAKYNTSGFTIAKPHCRWNSMML